MNSFLVNSSRRSCCSGFDAKYDRLLKNDRRGIAVMSIFSRRRLRIVHGCGAKRFWGSEEQTERSSGISATCSQPRMAMSL